MRSRLSVLAVAALGLTIHLSAVPPGHAPVRLRPRPLVSSAVFAWYLRLGEPGNAARDIEKALRVRTLDFGLSASESTAPTFMRDLDDPVDPLPGPIDPTEPDPVDPYPVDPYPPIDWPPDAPWPWPYPWPPSGWPPGDPWPPIGTTGGGFTGGGSTGGSSTGGSQPPTTASTTGGTTSLTTGTTAYTTGGTTALTTGTTASTGGGQPPTTASTTGGTTSLTTGSTASTGGGQPPTTASTTGGTTALTTGTTAFTTGGTTALTTGTTASTGGASSSTTGGPGGGTNGGSSGDSSGGDGDPTPPPIGPPPIGTPPEPGTLIPVPEATGFRYLSAGNDIAPNDPAWSYWRWYWYDYRGFVKPEDANNHPHPPVGTPPDPWETMPVPPSQDPGVKIPPGSSYAYRNGFYAGQVVVSTDADYDYDDWYWRTYVGIGGGTGGGTGTTGGTTGSTGGTTGSTTGSAPTPDTGWEFTVSYNNPGGIYAAPGGTVTGTKVECAYKVQIHSRVTEPGYKPSYQQVRVKNIHVWIGTETDSDQGVITPTLAEAPWKAVPTGTNLVLDQDYCPVFRFASTRFPDGTIVPVKVEAIIQEQNDGAPVDQTVPLTVNFTVYNKGLALATKQFYNLNTKVYTTEGTPTPGYYDWGSQLAIPGSIADSATKRLGQMNHALIGPSDGMVLGDPLLKSFATMTAFFAFTHGEPNCILASCGDDPAPTSTRKLNFGQFANGANSEVGKAVWHDPDDATKPRSAPRPNLIVLHACTGLQAGQVTGQAFGILLPGQTYDDNHPILEGRAYAGFQDVVNTDLSADKGPDESKPHHLQDHAKLVYERLLKGDTISVALKTANDMYYPQGLRLNAQGEIEAYAMLMKSKVDPHARLIGVYTGIDDPAYNAQNKLIWFMPLPSLPSSLQSSGSALSPTPPSVNP